MSNEVNHENQGNVVFGHNNFCQTMDAKWLCLEDIYQKFHRPSAYDIGATYVEDVADFSFMYKTKELSDIFLLQLFVTCDHDGAFDICLSATNELTFDKKSNIVYLDSTLKNYHVVKKGNAAVSYVTTYDFSNLDVDMLKDKKLYIRVSLQNPKSDFNTSEVADVKNCHDFGALLDDPVGSDFTIESSEGEKFQVHKFLLSSQSEVFKAMLKEETAEYQNSYVKLIDIEKADLQGILEFIYTGTVKKLANYNCVNLLMLADRYNLDGLKDLTQHVLYYQISADNVFDILVLADMYNADMLKLAAIKFIKKYNSILDSNLFSQVTNVQLVRELCKYLAA
ncbi:speckle-type POZ protein homolog [Battus philenor]|uniref:speckle-type POZ protein homolog n=1 Tax=Battus philenor TaxID=42288 RepID=UPI0035CFCA98